MEQCFPLSVKR